MSLDGALWDEYDAMHRPRGCQRCGDLGLEECECDPEEGMPTEPEDLPDDFLCPEWDQ